MSWTQIWNALYYVVCLTAVLGAQIPASAFGFLPHSWTPWITGVILVAAWLKSHWNYFINPNGTNGATHNSMVNQ